MARTVVLLSLLGVAAALRMKQLQQQVEVHSSGAVSSNCNVTVDTAQQTMRLESDIGTFLVQKDGDKGVVIDEQGNKMDSPPKALICLGNQEAPSDGPALMLAASGANYLMKKSSEGVPFKFFLNKHCWAKSNNMQYYLWFGNPVDKSGFTLKKEPDALRCRDGDGGNHYFVIAAVRQLLQERRNSWIISLDISDTFFPAKMAHTNMFEKFLDDRFDMVAGATASAQGARSHLVFINGAVIAYKNSEWGRNFAAEWFKNRCGAMNQLPLWASLFKLWQQDVPEFKFNAHMMSGYHDAMGYARSHAASLVKDPTEKAAYTHWMKTGKLTHSIAFPHVLLHANTQEGGIDGIAYRASADRSKDTFICHDTMHEGAGNRTSSCDAKQYMCTLPEQCSC